MLAEEGEREHGGLQLLQNRAVPDSPPHLAPVPRHHHPLRAGLRRGAPSLPLSCGLSRLVHVKRSIEVTLGCALGICAREHGTPFGTSQSSVLAYLQQLAPLWGFQMLLTYQSCTACSLSSWKCPKQPGEHQSSCYTPLSLSSACQLRVAVDAHL